MIHKYCNIFLLVNLLLTHSIAGKAQIDFKKYSTSYFGDSNAKTPLLIIATPDPGLYIAGSIFKELHPERWADINAHPVDEFPILTTIDSSDMHFFVANIDVTNAHQYEYRVSENGGKEIKAWSNISSFAHDSIQINAFKKGMAYLGGFHTSLGNFISLEVRKVQSSKVIQKAYVYWQQTSPAIDNVYEANELNLFLKRIKLFDQYELSEEEKRKWKSRYPIDQIDSTTHLPKNLIFEASNDNIIFLFEEKIFDRKVLEYQLLRNGKVTVNWKSNDFDNNFIWIKDLGHGTYKLNVRFALQRHNVTSIDFNINPFWYQTTKWKMVFGFLAFLILGSIYYFIRQRRLLNKSLKERESLQQSMKLLRSQLNPHFVFNALASIQGLVNTNKINEANHYLTMFSTILRQTLKNADKEMVPLQIELDTLNTYIQLEQLRFPFHYTLNVDKEIDIHSIDVPYLLFQPLVENAIKHGIAGLNFEGKLTIILKRKAKDLIVDITDNGMGFAELISTGGHGLKLTKERIALLNQGINGLNISMTIKSEAQLGTTITFEFKNYLQS